MSAVGKGCTFHSLSSTPDSRLFLKSPVSDRLVLSTEAENFNTDQMADVCAASVFCVPAPCPVGRKDAGRLSPYPILISPAQQCHLFAG